MSALRAACSAYGRARQQQQTPLPSGRRWFGRRSSSGGVTRVVGGGGSGSASGGGGGNRQKQEQRQQQQQRQDDEGSRGQQGFGFVRDVVWLACAYHCFTEYVAEPCAVRGPSMRPTIETDSWLLVDKRGGRSRELELGQIVLVKSPLEAGRMVVKRITGLPGDTISVRPPAWDEHNSLMIERRLEVVPEGHVWLAGDNSDNSKDSRDYGSVPQALVQGVVSLRLWPYREFGPIE